MNWRAVALWVATFAIQVPAHGQDKPTFVFRSELPGECVTTAKSAVQIYPSSAASAAGGTVRAKLRFASTDQPPRVEVFTNTGGEPFADAVQAHLAAYRVKCATALNRQLVQEFQFVPATRAVVPSVLRTNRESVDESTCERVIPPTPNYPHARTMDGAPRVDRRSFGNVLLRLTFEGSGEPGVIVIHDGGASRFVETAVKHATGYRLICADAAAYPIIATIPYKFMMEGDSPPEFKPISLTGLLRAVDRLESQSAYFDFASMTCPFQIAVYPLQPTYKNIVVNQSGHFDDRREFFAWLEGLTLKLPPDTAEYLKGRAVSVTVPCAVLNLL